MGVVEPVRRMVGKQRGGKGKAWEAAAVGGICWHACLRVGEPCGGGGGDGAGGERGVKSPQHVPSLRVVFPFRHI